MHAFLIATILLARATTAGPSTGLPTSPETPSATDLLRAKRMADEAARRLQVRPPKRGSWVSGGGEWQQRPSSTGDGRLPTRSHVR